MSEYVESKVYPSEDFHSGSSEGQFNCELKDGEAGRTQSAPEERNLLQSSFHVRLREQDDVDWSRERKVMQMNMEFMKSELERLGGALQNAHGQGAKQWLFIKDQQILLNEMKGEIKALEQELCAEKVNKTFIELELEEALESEKTQSQKIHCELSKLREAVQAQEEQAKLRRKPPPCPPETRKRSRAVLVAELREQTEENTALVVALEEAEREKSSLSDLTKKQEDQIACLVSQLHVEKLRNTELAAALEAAEWELEAGRHQQQDKAQVEEELEKQQVDTKRLSKVVDQSEDSPRTKTCFFCKDKKSTAEEATAGYIDLILSQLEQQKQKKQKLAAVLKKTEQGNSSFSAQLQGANLAQPDARIQITKDLMADLTRKLEGQTATFVAQLHEQKLRNTELLDALEAAEWELLAGWRQQQDIALVEEELEMLRVETEGLAKVVDQSKQLPRTQPSNKKSTIQESTEEHMALILSQLEQQKQKKQKLAATLEKAECEIEAGRIRWQEEAHVEEAHVEEELEKQQVETTNAATEEHIALILSKLERQRQKKKKLAAALKKAEQENSSLSAQLKDLTADLTRKHEAQTASFVAQLVEEKERNSTLAATLKKTKRELKDKSSLLQATEDLNETLREKEQEWNESESTLKTQLADLQNQIAKKKNKWLRRLFCCTTQH
ncbi:calponin homology domain-containing protein DDB_G0272472-like [Sebastes umbrosus]|uniref:calponin homology domain-containing protein DDB_G0272472-like n=1 Tax=Sebastes umbrosus TaxID=72105 RepID=UPI00189EBC63|nr:calponin homology domain-containing protein DDB_G0272472-like [Sebastes umbrosus]XP_037614268.1 calponin homology domain-containing protein DDB_G0272472-like [Sebastes umbrosus]